MVLRRSVLVLGATAMLFGCSEAPENTLVVGMELAFPPFEMQDTSGRPAGVGVDLANELGAFLNRPVRIENMAFDGLIPSLKTGKIHVIISSMTATEERDTSIDFSRPYLKTGLCLLAATNSPVQKVEELNDPERAVVVKRGTTGHLYAEKQLPKARLVVLDKESACVLEVVQGKADAFLYDQISTFRHWQQHPRETRAILTPFTEEYWSMGIREGNNELREAIDQFLHDFQSEGGFDRLGEKWLKPEKEAFRERGIPFYF